MSQDRAHAVVKDANAEIKEESARIVEEVKRSTPAPNRLVPLNDQLMLIINGEALKEPNVPIRNALILGSFKDPVLTNPIIKPETVALLDEGEEKITTQIVPRSDNQFIRLYRTVLLQEGKINDYLELWNVDIANREAKREKEILLKLPPDNRLQNLRLLSVEPIRIICLDNAPEAKNGHCTILTMNDRGEVAKTDTIYRISPQGTLSKDRYAALCMRKQEEKEQKAYLTIFNKEGKIEKELKYDNPISDPIEDRFETKFKESPDSQYWAITDYNRQVKI